MFFQSILYIVFITIGYSAPITEPVILMSMGMLLLGVVCASLIIPFGGLDKKTERISESVLLYGPISFIGWHIGNTAAFIGHEFDPAILGSTLFVAIILLSFWRTSYHSREYRFSNFLPLSNKLPTTTKVIVSLRIRKLSALADKIIVAIAENNSLPTDLLKEVGITEKEMDEMKKELSNE